RAFILPKLADNYIQHLTIYNLPDQIETTSMSSLKGVGYKGSILCLLSHSLESPGLGDDPHNVPLLGMTKFFDRPINIFSQASLLEVLKSNHGELILSDPDRSDSICAATTHAQFSDEQRTLNSTANRILGSSALRFSYQKDVLAVDGEQ